MKIAFSICSLILFVFIFKSNTLKKEKAKLAGLTLVAPPKKFSNNPMLAVKKVNATWIAVVPYAYTPLNKPVVRYNQSDWQWWGERPEGVIETIKRAKENDVKVMLKPQVYIHQGWTGELSFSDKNDCEKWEADYQNYILDMAIIADTCGADMFCIGTEFRVHIKQRPEFWTALIKDIRVRFSGKLTYSANWDDYMHVPFWSDLDYVGISAYFPLLEEKTPSITNLKAAWEPRVEELNIFSKKVNKEILFTEYGYLTTDFCAWRTWELEEKINSLTLNEQAQANSLDALLAVFSEKTWWAGGFLWKWFPNGEGHEGYPEKDYTPQGKLGAAVLSKHYAKCTHK